MIKLSRRQRRAGLVADFWCFLFFVFDMRLLFILSQLLCLKERTLQDLQRPTHQRYISGMYYVIKLLARQARRMVAPLRQSVAPCHGVPKAMLVLALAASLFPARAQDLPVVPDILLIEAARIGDIERITSLLQAGEKVDRLGNLRKSALHIAVEWNQKSAVTALVENGANLDRRTPDRNTPLTLAILRDRRDILAYLLEAGADANRTGHNYETPLLLATRLGYRATAALLIEAGADVTETDSTGRSALDWARDLRHQDLIALLEAAGN